jgi:uncharacterized protein (TIGR03067 family)
MRHGIGLAVVLVLATGPASSAPALKDPPKPPPDLAGEWEVESLAIDGRPLDLNGIYFRYRFTADGRWLLWEQGQTIPPTDEWPRYTADPTAAPAAVTLMGRAGANNSANHGIYRLEGDALILHLAPGKADRPAGFDTTAGVRYVLRRVK